MDGVLRASKATSARMRRGGAPARLAPGTPRAVSSARIGVSHPIVSRLWRQGWTPSLVGDNKHHARTRRSAARSRQQPLPVGTAVARSTYIWIVVHSSPTAIRESMHSKLRCTPVYLAVLKSAERARIHCSQQAEKETALARKHARSQPTVDHARGK